MQRSAGKEHLILTVLHRAKVIGRSRILMRLDMVNLDLLERDLLRAKHGLCERDPQTQQTGRGTVWLNPYTPYPLDFFPTNRASSANAKLNRSAVEFTRRYFRCDPD
jgi:hypothetical protein